MNNIKIFNKNNYSFEYLYDNNMCKIISDNKLVYSFYVDSAIDTLSADDQCRQIVLNQIEENNDKTNLTFSIKSTLWEEKEVNIELYDNYILYGVSVKKNDERILNVNYFLNRSSESNQTEFEKIYVPRFDWTRGKVFIKPSENDSLGCQQWLSPPPFCYVLNDDNVNASIGIVAKEGEYNFLSFDYNGIDESFFTLSYEGHTKVQNSFQTPKIRIGFDTGDVNVSVDEYIKWLRANNYLKKEADKDIPSWWKEPIFCGWGQMRYDYRMDHDKRENGTFINVTNYCTEKIYTNYMEALENNNINPGTIIIDMGWAENPALYEPSKNRWFDVRGFIDRQHQLGRKVLLWYTPVVTQGLPIDACMTLNGRAVAPDPTSPKYKEIMKEQIKKMLSAEDGCLNADGFKIDFTQNTPSENGVFRNYLNNFWALINTEDDKYIYSSLKERTELIKTHGNKWGVEILKEYITVLYENMKEVKNDSVLITHTANPYFAEVVDILRLNDLQGECDNVLDIMKNRAIISKMCSRNWLIDTDNDLMFDKSKWRDYIQLQPQLGIPDTYYITAIATSYEEFDEDDYELLRTVWSNYRKEVGLE